MPYQLQVQPDDGYPQVFAAQHLAWVLQSLPEVAPEKPDGEGSEPAPYCMSTIGQWMGASKIKLKPWTSGGLSAQDVIALSKSLGSDRGLYMIGGRLLERTPEGAYSNYITDVLDGGKARVGSGKPLPTFTGTTALERPRGFPSPVRQANVPVYDIKFDRLNDGAAESGKPLTDPGNNADMARQARALLKGANKMEIAPSDELPGTLGALFLAEVSREPRMLVITLMLLDLIEAGQNGFTWSSLMTDKGELTGGVRHPMVHFGAQAQAEAMFQALNDVTKRSVSILAAWLAMNPAKISAWTVTAEDAKLPTSGLPGQLKQVESAIGTEPASKTSKSGVLWRYYNECVLPAVKLRAKGLDRMP